MHEAAPIPSRNTKLIGSVALLSVLAAIAGWLVTSRMTAVPYAVLVDGEPLFHVHSLSAARSALRQARSGNAPGIPDGSIRFTRRVSLRRTDSKSELTDIPEAVGMLRAAVPVEVKMYSITADGEPIVALESEKNASTALKLVKKHYEKDLSNLVTESTFREPVYIEERFVGLEKIRKTPEDAAQFLTTPLGEPDYHQVERGDRAVKLAGAYGVSLNELRKLNPGQNLDKLVEGERLLLGLPKKPITVVSKAHVKKTVTLESPEKGGRAGKREMDFLVTYENGEIVSEELLSQVTTWDRPKAAYEKDKPVTTQRSRRSR